MSAALIYSRVLYFLLLLNSLHFSIPRPSVCQSSPMPARSSLCIHSIFFRKPPLDPTLPAPLLLPLLDQALLLGVKPHQSIHSSTFCLFATGWGVTWSPGLRHIYLWIDAGLAHRRALAQNTCQSIHVCQVSSRMKIYILTAHLKCWNCIA